VIGQIVAWLPWPTPLLAESLSISLDLEWALFGAATGPRLAAARVGERTPAKGRRNQDADAARRRFSSAEIVRFLSLN
jgi:hypothetical protein